MQRWQNLSRVLRYKDDEMIQSDAHGGVMIRQRIETDLLVSVLSIKRSKMTDSGEYLCQSSEQDVGRIAVYVLNGPSTFLSLLILS